MLRQGRIPVTFKILEKNDGFNTQIIYAGPSDVEVLLGGVVEGMGAPRNLLATGIGAPPAKGPPSFGARLFWILLPWAYVLWLLVLPIPAMIKHVRHQGPMSLCLLSRSLCCSSCFIGSHTCLRLRLVTRHCPCRTFFLLAQPSVGKL